MGITQGLPQQALSDWEALSSISASSPVPSADTKTALPCESRSLVCIFVQTSACEVLMLLSWTTEL